MEKTLRIQVRGERYQINPRGYITKGDMTPSGNWIFLGVSKHHWKGSIDFSFKEIWANPSLAIGGLVWDKDHGTIRQWAGSYFGRLPRITRAYIE